METISQNTLTGLSAKELCLHISEKYHKYLLSLISSLKVHLNASAKIDSVRFPYVKTSWEIFKELKELLENHLQKEEQILFPFAGELDPERKSPVVSLMENPLKKLKTEHKKILALFAKLSKVNKDYKAEPGCSPIGKLSLLEMEELEIGVKKSINIEENVLFPLLLTLSHDLNATRVKK